MEKVENRAPTIKPGKQCRYKFCSEAFVPARANQEFCCPQHKKDENNRIAKEERDLLKSINAQLRKNFRILKRAYTGEGTIVTYDELRSEGFDHTYHTSKAPDLNGNFTVPVYYIFRLVVRGNNRFLIQKQ